MVANAHTSAAVPTESSKTISGAGHIQVFMWSFAVLGGCFIRNPDG